MKRSDLSNTLDGINNNTYQLFFMVKEFKDEPNNDDKEFLLGTIQQFTKLNDKSIEYVLNKTDIFKRKDNVFEVNYNNLKYDFKLLDSYLIKNKEELRSKERIGKCIHKSISLANSYEGNCKVLLGYIYNNSDKLLHSVFLECSNNHEYVFDYTMNLIMEKEKYMELFDFKIINEIDGNDIKKDKNIILKMEYISSKFYLCFRDEIMKDLNKNSKVLKLED